MSPSYTSADGATFIATAASSHSIGESHALAVSKMTPITHGADQCSQEDQRSRRASSYSIRSSSTLRTQLISGFQLVKIWATKPSFSLSVGRKSVLRRFDSPA
jgi:hypothetical protein